MTKTKRCFTTVLAIALGFTAAVAQKKAGKPLTNDDVIAMVKKKLPESVIVSAIQTGPAQVRHLYQRADPAQCCGGDGEGVERNHGLG